MRGLSNKRSERLFAALLVMSFLAGLLLGIYSLAAWHRSLGPHDPIRPESVSPGQPTAMPAKAPPPPGRWTGKLPSGVVPDTETMSQIIALGYMAGSTPATSHQGVTHHNEELAYEGLNLYCSGHGQEALLIDMKGNVLHSWKASIDEFGPAVEPNIVRSGQFWRRIHLYEDGTLLALYDFLGLIKLDSGSRVLWSNWSGCHHDIYTEEERIHVLARELKTVPWLHPNTEIYEDYVLTLDAGGNELQRVSILECLRNSKYRRTLDRIQRKLDLMPNMQDVLHTNTIELLDGRLANGEPPFLPGRVLVSMLTIDTIGVIDVSEKKFVWLMGMGSLWHWQHQPTALDNGRLLIFANFGTHFPERPSSQVLEFDPFSHEVTWTYEADPPEDFFSLTCGSCQRLPNGNTLITESDRGRAFEVTPEGEIVWEFYNPAQIEQEDSILVATLFEVVRLPRDFPIDWRNAAASPGAQGITHLGQQ